MAIPATIDHLIVYAFLFFTLLLGLWAGRGIQDIKQYALAGKTYGTTVLLLTYLATDIGGGTVIGEPQEIFEHGILIVFTSLGAVVAYLMRAFLIAPKIVHFDNCLTMGDLMEEFYGTYSRIITGLICTLYAICITTIQLLALGTICSSLLGIPSGLGTILGGLIIAAYAAYGGIKAVTLTDVFQFLVLIVAIPTLASMAVGHTGGMQALFSKIPQAKLALWDHPNFSRYLPAALMWSVFQVGLTDPAIIQRLLMAKEARQLRHQYLTVALLDPAFQGIIMLIGLAGIVLYPSLEGQSLVPHLMQELLPVGIKGMVMAGLLAVVISTADSYLHAAGLSFSHDVIKPLSNKLQLKAHELKWARYSTFILGCIAIIVSLYRYDIMDVVFDSLYVGPLLMFPLVSGILGLKAHKMTFYITTLLTMLVLVVAGYYLPTSVKHLSALIGIMANGIIFFGIHLLSCKVCQV